MDTKDNLVKNVFCSRTIFYFYFLVIMSLLENGGQARLNNQDFKRSGIVESRLVGGSKFRKWTKM